jgi:hypothetical protein
MRQKRPVMHAMHNAGKSGDKKRKIRIGSKPCRIAVVNLKTDVGGRGISV